MPNQSDYHIKYSPNPWTTCDLAMLSKNEYCEKLNLNRTMYVELYHYTISVSDFKFVVCVFGCAIKFIFFLSRSIKYLAKKLIVNIGKPTRLVFVLPSYPFFSYYLIRKKKEC